MGSRTSLKKIGADWRHWLLATAVLLHLAMMASLFWGYLDLLFEGTRFDLVGLDFFSIYEAGRRAIENEPLYAGGFGAAVDAPYSVAYRYVPAFAYLFAAPVSTAPPWWAYWGWVAFNELLLVANAYATWRIGGRGTWGVIGAAMWFLFTPFYLHQYLGQFTFIMATALFWVGIGIVRGREIVAGIPWLASLITKSTTVLLGPLFVRLMWWRSLIVAAALALVNIPYFLWRTDEIDLFYRMNVLGLFTEQQDRVVHFNSADHSAPALLRNAFLAFDSSAIDVPPVYAIGLLIIIVGFSLEATFLARKPDPLSLFAMWISVFFLTYWAWEFDYVMLLGPLVLLIIFRPAARPWAIAAFVLIALPTPFWLIESLWSSEPAVEVDPSLIHLFGPDVAAAIQSVRGVTTGPGNPFLVQETWPAWAVIFHHAMKPVGAALLWGYLVVSQLRTGVGVSAFWHDAGTVEEALQPAT